jgi:hypothetical protein
MFDYDRENEEWRLVGGMEVEDEEDVVCFSMPVSVLVYLYVSMNNKWTTVKSKLLVFPKKAECV